MTDKRPQIAKSHQDFMRAAEEEFSKFERKERAFRQADWAERAAKLRLPIFPAKAPVRRDRRLSEGTKDNAC